MKSTAAESTPPRTDSLKTLCIPETPILPGICVPVALKDTQLRIELISIWNSQEELILVPSLESPMGCVVKIIACNDENGDALLRGIRRVLLKPEAQDRSSEQIATDRSAQRASLLQAFWNRFPNFSHNPLFASLWERELSFGALCDMLAHSCQLNRREYSTILNEVNEDERCELVLNLLKSERDAFPASGFHPRLSLN